MKNSNNLETDIVTIRNLITKVITFLSVFFCVFVNQSCSSVYKTMIYNEREKSSDSLSIREGLLCQHAQRITYKGSGKTKAIIELSEPVIVSQSDQEEKWGFYQFPSIGKAKDGTLIVSWHMREDSHKAYGRAGRKYTPMMSKNGGKTWVKQDKSYFAPTRGYNGVMRDGSLLQIVTPYSKNIREYSVFPKSVTSIGARSFYKHDELPLDLQGVYLQYVGENLKSRNIHATLDDPGLLRNTIGDLLPLVWWGNIIQMADKSLIAGVYPCRYIDKKQTITRSSVSFYQSKDGGESWHVMGRIPCQADGILDKYGDNEFDEPTFEILKDSTFICIMRSGSTSPMYKTFSKDKGKTWSHPVPFTPNGVNPKVMLLENNVLVLASGRPGVQLRFSLDGTGKNWTDPIEMLPFTYTGHDNKEVFEATCGYANLIAADENSFYIVYSDFKARNKEGKCRKAILCRKVEIVKLN